LKVYFTLSMQEGCYFYRCLTPLIAGGWDGDKTSLRNWHFNENSMAQACMDADIVVFQRPNDERCLQIADTLRKLGKKIVMDSDDTYKDIDGHKFEYLLDKVNKYLDEFGRKADLITCPTEFLAKEYRELNDNVAVLPNCIDPNAWPEPLRNEGDKVRIGVVGSTAYESDWQGFKQVLESLNRKNDVQLVLFGLPAKDEDTARVVQKVHAKDYAFWESLNIEWQPLVPMADYFDTLNELRLDLMLIPRADRYFNRCKSNLKFLEASMLEIPVIAQGFTTNDSPYQQNPKDSQFMRVIIDNSKWMDEIKMFLRYKSLRRDWGQKAKQYVLENYNIAVKIHLWEQEYAKLFG